MHCTSKKHTLQKKCFETKDKVKSQQILQTSLFTSESKKKVIEDLIEVFANANILLEKINLLLLFFKKYLKEEEAIPQASTLCSIYLPRVFDKHIDTLKSIFNAKLICIIMDESSDNCAQNVVNTLFTYRSYTKLVSVNFLE